MLLNPGAYRIIVRPAFVSPQPLAFRVLAAIVTDPLAVPRTDTVNTPLTTTGLDDDFVFPNPGGNQGGGGGPTTAPSGPAASRSYVAITDGAALDRVRHRADHVTHPANSPQQAPGPVAWAVLADKVFQADDFLFD